MPGTFGTTPLDRARSGSLAPAAPPGPPVRRLALCGILLLALGVRLPGVVRPLTGPFATKNVVSAMVARNWASGQADWKTPTLDQLADGQPSWHLVELPLPAYLAGWCAQTLGGSLDIWGRALNVGWSLACVALGYALAASWYGRSAAAGAALVLALSPVGAIYGQSFQLEPGAVCLFLLTLLAAQRFLADGRWGWLPLAGGAWSAALLTKCYLLAGGLPLVVLVWQAARTGTPRSRGFLLLTALVAGACAAAPWYYFVWQVSAPDSADAGRIFYSLRQSRDVQTAAWNLLQQADFYRQLLDDLAGRCLTPLGLGLALLGLGGRLHRAHWAWLFACAVLIAGLPHKFYRMDYYWLIVAPPLALLAGLGWQKLLERGILGRRAAIVGVAFLLLFSLRYVAGVAWRTLPEDEPVLPAAAAARALVPAGEPVVAIHGSTLDLLYYCNRQGWAPSIDDDDLGDVLAGARAAGARFVVVAGPRRVHPALQELPLERRGAGYEIYRLPP